MNPHFLISPDLRSCHLVRCCADIADFISNLAAVLCHPGELCFRSVSKEIYSLSLHLVQLVHLLGHLGDGVGLLLLQAHQGGVMLDTNDTMTMLLMIVH